jgi:tryptophan halogenase
MQIPDTLHHKIDVYRSTGHLIVYDEPFLEPSWLAIYSGLNIEARRYDRLADAIDLARVREHFSGVKAGIRDAVSAMPSHSDYIARHCRAAAA